MKSRAITNTDLSAWMVAMATIHADKSVLDGSGESLVKIGDEILRVLDAHA
jgi:hypothetical protein